MSQLPRPLKRPPTLPIDKGLVLWLPFDERSGARAYDRSRTRNHGTLVGCTRVAGPKGSALSFNGTSDYVTTPHNANILFTSGPFTVELWFKNSLLGAGAQIVGKGIYNTDGWRVLWTSGNALYFTTYQLGTSQHSYTGALLADVWYHAVFVRVGSVVIIYLNGIDSANTHGSHSNPVTNTRPFVGGVDNTLVASFFKGIIHNVRIYNRALTAAEVKRLYESEIMLVRS